MFVFHSLQAVKRRFSTARLLTDYFKEIGELFHEAVYTLDAYRFSKIEATLCTIDHDGLDEYFRIHWFEWKPELWALHKLVSCFSMGNNTNNRIERYLILYVNVVIIYLQTYIHATRWHRTLKENLGRIQTLPDVINILLGDCALRALDKRMKELDEARKMGRRNG